MAHIIVTGGAGFIGSHLVDELVRRKHTVTIIDNLSTGQRININPAAHFIKLDIRSARLKNVFREVKPEIVFHLAAQKSVNESVIDPIHDAQINILGSINLFENCQAHKVKKIIFSSSGGAVYGDTDSIPTPENTRARPMSPYGVAKLAVEKYLHYYHVTHGLTFVSLRYANVYGPRQDPVGEAGVVAIFIDKIIHHRQPFINGTGRQTRDYVYVGDVVASNIRAMNRKIQGIYNIGTGRETSVNQLYDSIQRYTRSHFNKKYHPAIKGEQQRSCLQYKKFRNIADWRPVVTLGKGLQLTYQSFKKAYEK